MILLMIVVFIIGYFFIAMEHPFQINKTATALLLATIMWMFGVNYLPEIRSQLIESLGEVAEILFFLMGAMTIVEIIDSYGGFKIITDKIKTTKKVKLLWLIAIITFFMSAVLDNLTSSIVMVALLRKLIGERKDHLFFAGIIILAANAGGVWTPIGDVTTIMLWIAEKVSTINIMKTTFLASVVSFVVPLSIISFTMKGNVVRPEQNSENKDIISAKNRFIILCLGVGMLVAVPVFKALSGLPPYLGMIAGLAILWMVTGFMAKRSPEEYREKLTVTSIISKIDISSILFFLGILMAVNALSVCGHLSLLSESLDKIPLEETSKYYFISTIIGLLSSIVDNVPLVAAAMKMYDFQLDHYFWTFLSYTAGTGGSILIIGSAAGVAVMGMEKIDFIWYLKKISWLALLGYIAGCAVYIAQELILAA